MSAQLQTQNNFTAFLALAAGVTVNVNAPTLESLAITVAKVQGTAANDTPAQAPAPAAKPADTKADAGKATPATTPAPATAPPAASGSASGAEAKRPTYDDVKDRVLKLAKVSRETATAALAKFGVDHGNKLKLEQYADFLAHADSLLKVPA